MFDIGWYELLVIGVVALLVVGPKELPTLLRTIGRYVGMMQRQAAEFRNQFDQAMRESELDKIKQEMEKSTEEATSAIRDAESALDRDLDSARREMDEVTRSPSVDPLPPADAAEIAAGASETGATVAEPLAPPPAANTSVADAAARAAARSATENPDAIRSQGEPAPVHSPVNGTRAGMNGGGSAHAGAAPAPVDAGVNKG